MDQTELDFRVREHCLDRLAIPGYRACNACLGESMRFEHATPITIDAMAAWIAALPHAANSGDVYVSLEPARLRR